MLGAAAGHEVQLLVDVSASVSLLSPFNTNVSSSITSNKLGNRALRARRGKEVVFITRTTELGLAPSICVSNFFGKDIRFLLRIEPASNLYKPRVLATRP